MSAIDTALQSATNQPIFPCNPKNKGPYIAKAKGGNGFKDATRDPATIRAWWTDYPDALIGLPTGATTGLIVVDDDTPSKPDAASTAWVAQNRALLESTMHYRTRSGGSHYVFQLPAGVDIGSTQGLTVEGQKLNSIDTRGNGGYIIWWPAHGSAITGTVQPLPQSLIDQLTQRPVPKPSAPVASTPTDWSPGELRRALAFIPPPCKPGYGAWLEIGQGLHHESAGSDEGLALWDEWSAGNLTTGQPDNYEADACRQHWASFGKNKNIQNPITAGTLYLKAKQNGYVRGVDVAGKFGGVLPAGAALDPPRAAVEPRHQIYTFEEYSKREVYIEWAVSGVLPATGTGVIYAPSQMGKSFVVTDLGGAIAKGQERWFGHRIKQPRRVLYIALEGAAGIKQRLDAYAKKYGPPAGLSVMPTDFDLREPAEVELLIAAISATEWRGGVIFIDTLAQAMGGGNENSPDDMGKLVIGLQRLQRHTGGMVVMVHHEGKDESKGMRGHTSLKGAIDVAIWVGTRDEVDEKDLNHTHPREWRVTKLKDGETGQRHPFMFEVVPLDAVDDEGKPVTSLVVVAEFKSVLLVPAKKKLQKRQQAVLNQLRELIANSPAGTSPIINGKPTVSLLMAEMEVAKKMPYTKDSDKKREAAKVIRGLMDLGYVEFQNDYVWLA